MSIICFKHLCDEKTLFIALKNEADLECKSCRKIDETSYERRLIEIPYPFCEAPSVSCDILLIPAEGTFLKDFNNEVGLHAGISLEDSSILEYDQHGLKTTCAKNHKWQYCLSLNFIDLIGKNDTCYLKQVWSETAKSFSGSNDWSSSRYHSSNRNCLDFIIVFIKLFMEKLSNSGCNDIRVQDLREKTQSKEIFCDYFVVPKTKQVARYLALYRKLEAQ